ncbi:MAG: hypothetical protein WC100_02435 [Sterolibacterium sp.]
MPQFTRQLSRCLTHAGIPGSGIQDRQNALQQALRICSQDKRHARARYYASPVDYFFEPRGPAFGDVGGVLALC